MAEILWPWKVEGEFLHGVLAVVGGNSERECVERLGSMEDKYGKLLWYIGRTDEDYEDGKYIGSENFVSSESEGV